MIEQFMNRFLSILRHRRMKSDMTWILQLGLCPWAEIFRNVFHPFLVIQTWEFQRHYVLAYAIIYLLNPMHSVMYKIVYESL